MLLVLQTSVGSVITTLDPEMEDYLCKSLACCIILCSHYNSFRNKEFPLLSSHLSHARSRPGSKDVEAYDNLEML